jgi:signal peptidase
METALRTIRRLIDAALVALVGAVLALVLAATVGPLLGHQLLVIRGGSMAPAIALGSVIDVARVDPSDLRVGDVVTIKAPHGVLTTHRVTQVVQMPDGLYLQTKGDANAQPDPALVPASAVTGRVDFSLPLLGYFMYMLTTPAGLVSIISLGLTLVFAGLLIEEIDRTRVKPLLGELIG